MLVEGKKVCSRGLVLSGTMDSPAKADAQYFVHHNGCNGCPFCLNPGKNVSTEHVKKKSTVHVYPCQGHYELRTREGTLHHAEEASTSGNPVKNFVFFFLLSFFFIFFLAHFVPFFFLLLLFFLFFVLGLGGQVPFHTVSISSFRLDLGAPCGLYACRLSGGGQKDDVALV